jgi:5'-nucleotidase
MPHDLSKAQVIGISSSALFDMTESDRVFREQGLAAYSEHQEKNANVPLPPGTGFPLIRAVLRLNEVAKTSPNATRKAEVVVASKNSPSTCRRLYNSIKYHGLDDIQRSFLSGGAPIAPYLEAFSVDLFLSTNAADVEAALRSKIPAARIYDAPSQLTDDIAQIRIAFDGDNVLFSGEAEDIFQKSGMDAFVEHETQKAHIPLPEGPFATLLKVLSFLQQDPQLQARPPVRIALVTARSMPTHERVLTTLEHWKLRVDEAFFMGGVDKTPILQAFRPHIYFDDQAGHCERAASHVPTALVPIVTQALADSSIASASLITNETAMSPAANSTLTDGTSLASQGECQ